MKLSKKKYENLEKNEQKSFNIGEIKSITSGKGFNLLITEKEEVFAQVVDFNLISNYYIGQSNNLKFDFNKNLFKIDMISDYNTIHNTCLLYTSPSPRDGLLSRIPSSA